MVEDNPINNYFGVGEDSLGKLNFPGFPGNFDTYAEYKDASTRRRLDGKTYAKYNNYAATEYRFEAAVERDLFGGLLRPLVGLKVGYVDVDDYSFERVSARGGTGLQRPTKLFEDCLRGVVTGCNGGWGNYLKLGLSYDSRDFEPDPSQGILSQATAEISTKLLGSQFEYQRLTFSTKLYYSLFPEITRLVFASRITYSMQFGDVPVFSLPYYAFNTRDRKGLGGLDTFRVRFRSGDRPILPPPFSRVLVHWMDPTTVPRDAGPDELEVLRAGLDTRMAVATQSLERELAA